MEEFTSRYGKSLAIALGLHIMAASVIGLVSFQINKTPPNIMEVTLAGGGDSNSGAVSKAENTVLNIPITKEDIVDKKLKPQIKQEQQGESNNTIANNGIKQGNSTGNGSGTSSANGSGEGTGSGNGTGSGEGLGSGLAAPAIPPRLVAKSNPRYPLAARSKGITGVAKIRMLVNGSGRVEEAAVTSSSGNADLDNSAVECVYKWRFTPAKNSAGKAVPCYIVIPVRFSLN